MISTDTPTTNIDITASTDVAWAGGSPPVELDDPGSSVDVPQIFIRTNGKIIDTELQGDMYVGHIHSTQNDVVLFSPAAILDADGLPTVDVVGRNITMTAGDNGVGGVSGRGGVGTPANFLEINVAAGSYGVLNVTDTAAATHGWDINAIYACEPPGHLRQRTVRHLRRLHHRADRRSQPRSRRHERRRVARHHERIDHRRPQRRRRRSHPVRGREHRCQQHRSRRKRRQHRHGRLDDRRLRRRPQDRLRRISSRAGSAPRRRPTST